MSIHFAGDVFTLSSGTCSYVLHITLEKRLMNLYWGSRLPNGALCSALGDYPGFASFDLDRLW